MAGHDEVVGGTDNAPLVAQYIVAMNVQRHHLCIANYVYGSRRFGLSLASDGAAETSPNRVPCVTMNLQLRHSRDDVSHDLSNMEKVDGDDLRS